MVPSPASVLLRTEAVLDGLGAPFSMRDLLAYPLQKAEAQLARNPRWPVLQLPLTLATDFGLPAELCEGLAVACLLLYGFADLTDDAQDGDLQGDWAWQRAVNGGFALAFLGQEVLGGLALPEVARARLVLEFARAGRGMTFGQERDLLASYPAIPSIEEYLEAVNGKTGASVAFFATAPAIAALQGEHVISGLRTYGSCLGSTHQILSDMGEYRSTQPSGSDVRNRKLTLPVLYGLAQDSSGEVRRWLEGDSTVSIEAVLERLGAPAYCRMKAQLFRRKALVQLEGLGLGPQAEWELSNYLEEPRQAQRLEL